MIVVGMWVQALGIWLIAFVNAFAPWLLGSFLLGLGTALVYPTLLAAVSDVAHPEWRASAVGVYRLWRDGGYALGAVLSGVLADLFGLKLAVVAVGVITFLSGVVTAIFMYETLVGRKGIGSS
jgi:MFS family permease